MERRILVSFVGTGNYQETHYTLQNKSITTDFFPNAAQKFSNSEITFLVMTKEARAKFGHKAEELEAQIIDIPTGKNEEEIWQIFQKISEKIEPNSILCMDITHGFRSQPFIALSIATYLQNTRNVIVDSILYGAFEAKNDENISPVFELKPFITLLDWSFGIAQLVKYGNATAIQNKMTTIHKSTHQKTAPYKSKNLQKAGKKLSELTESLAINHITDALNAAKGISSIFESVKEDISNLPEAKPINDLLQIIPSKFHNIEAAEGDIKTDQGFVAQSEIIKYYLENSQYVQAITVLREAFISKWCMFHTKEDILDKDNSRKRIEDWLGTIHKLNQGKLINEPNVVNIANWWSRITEVRNQIDHAFMRKNPTPSSTAIKNVKSVCIDISENFLSESLNAIKQKYKNLPNL